MYKISLVHKIWLYFCVDLPCSRENWYQPRLVKELKSVVILENVFWVLMQTLTLGCELAGEVQISPA